MKTRDLMIILFLSLAFLFLCQTGLASPLFNARFDFNTGDEPQSVAIGDLNGDDVLDLAVANEYSNNVSVLLGNGDGTFQSAVHYGVGDRPSSVATADMDGDGALPVDPTDKRLNKLFPEAAVVYGYEKGKGYVRVKPDEELEVGKGYWILLNEKKATRSQVTRYLRIHIRSLRMDGL